MPTGSYTRRMAENEFKPKGSIRMAIEWLEWMAHKEGIYIRNQLNSTEKRIGGRKLLVDGFNPNKPSTNFMAVIGTAMTARSSAEKNLTKDETNPWRNCWKKPEPIQSSSAAKDTMSWRCGNVIGVI